MPISKSLFLLLMFLAQTVLCKVIQTIIVDYFRIFNFLVACPQYMNLTDADRKYGPDTTGYPKCDDMLHGWYRFQGDAGRKMMTTCLSINKCGGMFTAWLNGDHPTVAQGSVQKKVCFRKSEPGDCCDGFYFTYVKNCGSYFIYKLLPDPFSCDFRYCGTD